MSNQAPEGKLQNDWAQGSRSVRQIRAPKTKPLAGRDPVQPNNRGNQGQS